MDVIESADAQIKHRLTQLLAALPPDHGSPGCCTLLREGHTVAVVSGVTRAHCEGLAQEMDATPVWKAGECHDT